MRLAIDNLNHTMRIGLRGAFGQSTINLPDDATVSDLSTQITEVSSYVAFDLKAGFPPKSLDLTQFDPTLKLADTGLKLNGERIQVEERKMEEEMKAPLAGSTPSYQPPVPTSQSPAKEQQMGLKKKPRKFEEDPPALELSNGSFLVHRVMPDDNSCLFRALGKCLLGGEVDGMTELRSMVAQGIQADTERFSEVVLEKDPDEYGRWIQQENSWGGATEVIIIAEAFGVEVLAVNLQDVSVQRFNEGMANRVFLVYSGIHWDCLVANPIGQFGPPEVDIAQFDANDVEIEEKAKEIGRLLQQAGYYTNTTSFDIKCNTCGWTGKGEKAAVEHYNSMGHSDFGEA